MRIVFFFFFVGIVKGLQTSLGQYLYRRGLLCKAKESASSSKLASTLNLSSIVNAGYDGAIERLRESVAEIREKQAANTTAVVDELTAAIVEEEEKALEAMEKRVTQLVAKVEKEEASLEAALDDVRTAQTEVISFDNLVQIYTVVSLLIAGGLSFIGFNVFLSGGG
eukprot:CAMPEP_0197302760 /NCGR_PEP_ID=MMETSP0890-20130614/51252_1 /TAXON_ID=44058 ORGANISM="Aureoumbra lagunensis, Strain CCMP1510" /NCGR_SAMPLE_ID=MMETSP0890 /ASSEMBLY_ACC=CAM_ASM_000533 /LENGTH=166 /DNA_ID=CAMNT_0042782447 /DNA_START=1087 /DNA_END=1587 /DNA_ORIENTATION=+